MPEQKAPHARPDYVKTAASGVQASLQATSPAGGSVWGKLVSVFPGHRVRPESAGAQSRASAAPSAQTAKAPRRPMTERLFGTKGRQRQNERSLKNTRAQGGHSESLSRTTAGNPQQHATEAAAPATEAGEALPESFLNMCGMYDSMSVSQAAAMLTPTPRRTAVVGVHSLLRCLLSWHQRRGSAALPADNENQAVLARACMAEAAARKERMLSSSMSAPAPKEKSVRSTGKVRRHQIKATQNRCTVHTAPHPGFCLLLPLGSTPMDHQACSCASHQHCDL